MFVYVWMRVKSLVRFLQEEKNRKKTLVGAVSAKTCTHTARADSAKHLQS